MIKIEKLNTVFPELPHSLDSTGFLDSAKKINLHTIWKDEWSRVHASAFVNFDSC